MTNVLSRALPPPTNWKDFEHLCFDIYSGIWKTNDAQFNGRQGQPQHGVDIYGTDRVENVFVGVQCKGKDQSYGNPLTEAELRSEVEKAKSFTPPIHVFILATTAPNDAAIQKTAREITEDHKARGLFEVRVEGWTTLAQYISNDSRILTKHFTDFAPIDLVSVIEATTSAVREEAAETRAFFQQTSNAVMAVRERNDSADRLQMRIDVAAKLVEDGLPSAGRRALELLVDQEFAKASPRNRYRIRANIGIAYLTLGEKTRAVVELRAAAAEDPTWPGAQAILATAELLDGNDEQAYSIASAVLTLDSGSHQAATVLVGAAPLTIGIQELEARIPPAHLERLDVLLSLSYHALKVGDNSARERLIARIASLFPDDWRALAAQAEVLLEKIFSQEALAFTRAVPATQVADLERGITLLQKAWDLLLKRDNVRVGAYVAANLLSALEISGRATEHDQLLAKALEVAPDFPPLLRNYAQSMVAEDNWTAAAKALDAIPDDQMDVLDRLLRVQTLIHLGEPQLAATRAREIESEVETGRHAEVAAAMQIEAAHQSNSLDAALPDILGRWPRSIMLRSLAHNFMAEGDTRRSGLLLEIEALSDAIADPRDRMHAADALYAAKQYQAAAALYEGLYSPGNDSLPLFRRLKALYFAQRRREARDLFDRLGPTIKTLPRYADLGVAIYEQAGLLREAREIQEAILAQDDTLRRRIHWLALSERLGELSEVIAWLDTIPANQPGSPQDLMAVALTLDRLQADPRCFRLAYRALRSGYGDPDMHLAYMIGLAISGRSHSRAFSKPTKVQRDTAVLLEEKNGPRKLVRVLETDSDPRIERGEIAPDAELGPLLMNKSVGDEVEVGNLGIEPTVYVVKEIRDKYLHAHFRSEEQFESLFPDNRGFGTFHIDESKGDDKFKPLFDSVKRRGEHALQLIDMYRKGQLPVMLMSKLSGVDPFDTWEHIVAQPDLPFLSATGHPQEFNLASARLQPSCSAVIDPVTVYALTRLGIAEKVLPCFDTLGVTQTTIDLIRRLIVERTQARGRRHGTFGWDGEHYRMVEVDEAYDDEQIRQAEAALAFALQLWLVPAEASTGIKDDALRLFEDVDDAFLDTIYAAQGANALIYSDDQILRQVASELSGVPGIWTQAIAVQAAQTGRIFRDDYLDVIGAIASADYRFTSIDYQVILHALGKSEWIVTPAIDGLLTQIALPTNEINSVKRLLADLMQFGWREKPTTEAYTRFFVAALRTFYRLQPSVDLLELINASVTMVQGRVRSNGYRHLLRGELLGTTNHTPAAEIVRSVARAADNFLRPIANALSGAFQIASSFIL